ncbi:MAG: bis(5'-nucleosyl)-tetraphosphatase (symmetrical) YqeK [Lachnospiraceae bacterium]|nr:bis(5'-nucleosyl)-tetraphosphatase (symmetrical) YqeK [Lachnospiraceae bacterium]
MKKIGDINKIRRSVEKTLDPKRYEHTLGVAYTAAALAMRYGADICKAQIAGLLHDCAKCVDHHKKIAICEKNNIEINNIERANPFLLHAKVGSYIATDKHNIADEDIIQAILNHTTGRPAMSLLEKIVYVADYIEPNRLKAPNLTLIRAEAFNDIDKALMLILKDTLVYLDSLNSDIDPKTRQTYEYYVSKVRDNIISQES